MGPEEIKTENAKTIDNIIKDGFSVGQVLRISETITPKKVKMFAETTGDKNPIHLSESFAKTTRFMHRIAHGMLSASYISKLLGTTLPGTIYIDQELHFKKPVYMNEILVISAKIIKYNQEKEVLTLNTTVTNQDYETVIEGNAVIMVKGVRELLASAKRK